MFPFAYPGNAHSHHGCVGHMVSTTLRTWWAAWPNYISTTASLSLSVCLSVCWQSAPQKLSGWLFAKSGIFLPSKWGKTYQDIVTQDRLCPNGTHDKTRGGCPCVQVGGDPGLPSDFQVKPGFIQMGCQKCIAFFFCFVCRLDVGIRSFSLCLVAAPHLQ